LALEVRRLRTLLYQKGQLDFKGTTRRKKRTKVKHPLKQKKLKFFISYYKHNEEN